jgi:hypothetical protein
MEVGADTADLPLGHGGARFLAGAPREDRSPRCCFTTSPTSPQMPIAYNQTVAHSHHADPCGIECSHLLFDRGLQWLACSFLEQLFEKRFLFIFSSLTERDHFTLGTGASFLLASSGDATGFLY